MMLLFTTTMSVFAEESETVQAADIVTESEDSSASEMSGTDLLIANENNLEKEILSSDAADADEEIPSSEKTDIDGDRSASGENDSDENVSASDENNFEEAVSAAASAVLQEAALLSAEEDAAEETAFTLTVGETTTSYEASSFNSLSTYLTNAQNDGVEKATLALTTDIPATSFTKSISIPSGFSLILELNGHSMTSTGRFVYIDCKKSSALTIQDSSEDNSGEICSPARYLVKTSTGAEESPTKVTLQSGTIKMTSTGQVFEIGAYSQVEINGGVLKGLSSGYLFKGSAETALLTINGGTVDTVGSIFYTHNMNVIVNGGSLRTTSNCIADDFLKAAFNGGKFYCPNSDINTAFYTYGNEIIYPQGKYLAYNTEEKCYELADRPEVEDSGSLAVTLPDGTESVYQKVADAFSAVKNGGVIKLTGDSALINDDSLMLNGDVTLDLNGYRLTLKPFKSSYTSGTIHIEGGILAIQDSGTEGTLDFGDDTNYGITFSDGSGSLILKSGTISGTNSATIIAQAAYRGTITMEGGTILPTTDGHGIVVYDTSASVPGDGRLVVSGGKISTRGSGACVICTMFHAEITGDAVLSASGTTAFASSSGESRIDGNAEISSEGSLAAVNYNYEGTHEIAGNAYIHSDNGRYAIYADSSWHSKITISEDARIECPGYAVNNAVNESENHAVIQVDGGHYKYGSIPFSHSAAVTYKESEDGADTYIISPEADTDGDYEGYHSLVLRKSLDWEDTSTTPATQKTYQDFEELNYAIASAEAALENSEAYTSDSVEEVNTALGCAKAALTNANANQNEIDYWCELLNDAVATLVGTSDLNPSELADGTYAVDVAMRKAGTTGASMTSGAVDGTATLYVEDGAASLVLSFHPTNVLSLWGHLTDLWLYKGNTAAENAGNAGSWDGNTSTRYDYMENTQVLSYYSVDASAPSAAIPCVDCAHSASEHYPYEISVPLYYISTSEGGNIYTLRVSVDQMTGNGVGDQNVDMYVKWGTLKALSLKPTLSVDKSEISLIAGESSEAKSETVAAVLQAADGYTLEWKSSDEKIAAVTPGEDSTATVTAVAEGECTITATASKEGEDPLTKTVKVTVAAQDSAPVKVESVIAEGTAAKAVLSGDVLVTNGAGEGVSVEASEVTIAAASEDGNITSAEVVIPDSAAEALKAKNTTITTDVGSVKLDSALMTQIASMSETSSDTVTLKISEAKLPETSLGTYSDAYEITLVDKDGKTVEFGSGKAAVTVSCSDSNVQYAYYIKDGKRAERQTVTYDETAKTASFTTTHFSLWALSANEYAVDSGSSSEGSGSGGGNGGTTSDFFLSDGNYYVDIDLWKAASNEQSMGHVAFKNNDRALVTVKNGKVTTVRIATNPVDVDQYHSAITSFEVDDADVTVLKKGSVTTKPAGKDYEYIQMVEFQMPSAGQPDIADATTYVPVTFWVPDTPMDAAVGEELNARLKFIWSTASKTSDTSLNANSSSASGSSSITGEDIKSLTLTDKATGIKLDTNTERLSDKAEMTVSKLTSGADYDTAVKAMEGISGEWSLYKIDTAVDGKSTAPEGSVTLSFPCGTEELTIYRISDSGTKTVLKGSVKDGYYVLSTSQLGMFAVLGDISDDIPVVVPEGEFADVQNHWAKEYVNTVVQRGLFNGVSDTQFSPNTSMTRAMFVTVLGRLAGADVSSAEKTAFTDVKEGSWYASYVSWGVDNGIVKGVSDTSFAPDQTITRQEMAVFLSRYAEFAKITLKDGDAVNFADSSDISAYAADAVSQMAKAGLLNGVGDNKFAPKNTATRAEVAALLARFIADYSL